MLKDPVLNVSLPRKVISERVSPVMRIRNRTQLSKTRIFKENIILNRSLRVKEKTTDDLGENNSQLRTLCASTF